MTSNRRVMMMAAMAACLVGAAAAAEGPKGRLVVVGGAFKDPVITKRTLELAGGVGGRGFAPAAGGHDLAGAGVKDRTARRR